jgi:hypothetical protein
VAHNDVPAKKRAHYGLVYGHVLLIALVVFFLLYRRKVGKESLSERVKAACKQYLETLGEDSMIGGQVIKGEEEFTKLEEQGTAASAVKDTESRMRLNATEKTKKEKMRVLHLRKVLTWDKMPVYEEVDDDDVYELTYDDAIKEEIWKSLLILSWR